MYSNFLWPIPPYFELPPGEEFSGHEPALLMLAKGQKLSGSLTRFLPGHGVIEFLPSRGRVNLDVPLVDVLQLRLTRPLILRLRVSEIERRSDDPSQHSPRQPFKLTLVNGDVVEGETVGFEAQGAGLFLYVVSYGEAVVRVFVPSTSIREQQIGKPIGQVLMDEKLATGAQIRSALDRQQELREQKIGDILAEQEVISAEELHEALQRQRAMPLVKLGESLVESGMIGEQQLNDALDRQKQNRRRPLGEILIEMGALARSDLFRALSQKLGVPSVDLKRFRIDSKVLKAIPDSLIREHNVVPLCLDGNALVVAIENPLNPIPLEQIRFLTQRQVSPVMAAADDIASAIREHFSSRPAGGDIQDLASQLSAEVIAPTTDEEIRDSDSTLVRVVNKMVIDAHAAGASDIHVEANAGRRNVVIRFRRDGALSEYLQLPANFRAALVSRIKIMASLDISERRRAQDGRIAFQQFGPAQVDLRVAIVPTQDGLEDVVLRLLSAGEPLPLMKVGLREPLLNSVRALLSRPHGLILVCGPTGSGKTTTLHSLLAVLNAPDRKIWTAEDPVEISQSGLRQVQVNAKIGWTFAAAMRALLRADPDVIMVGEMRDAETASIAIEASLTGHLVLSTLHTNSAPETVVRLVEMGMDPFSFADALGGVLAQRLARRLCAPCRERSELDPAQAQALADEYCAETPLRPDEVLKGWYATHGNALARYTSKGCDQCRGTGYRGRVGLHELLVTTPDLRQLVQKRATASQMRGQSVREGMLTLRQDGIEKCLTGTVDLAEVRAVTA